MWRKQKKNRWDRRLPQRHLASEVGMSKRREGVWERGKGQTQRGREKNKARQGIRPSVTEADWRAERADRLLQNAEERKKRCTYSTFSFGPEYESPQGGDYLKLVVTHSSHLSDSTGQDHSFRVHLLHREKDTETDRWNQNTYMHMWE